MSGTQPMPADGSAPTKGATDPTLGPALELLGQNVGGYVVEALLGVGGMGLVYQAKLAVIARKFAIKVLRPEVAADPVVSANFIREAQTLSQLKHPHIIDIVGFGQLDAQRQYMVMEFLEGHTLADELEEHGALLPSRALALADDMLDALEAAHSVEVIHRDLKPGNVFLARVSGGTEVVKLLDFGLAKVQPVELAEGTVTEAGKSVVAGTPEYIAPEQARGQTARKHSDLYSFGVMLYEMLTGHQPFEVSVDSTDRVVDLLRAHLHEKAPRLTKYSAVTFPEELEELVADLLDKDPQARPSSAGVVRARLAKVMREFQAEATRQHGRHVIPGEVAIDTGLPLQLTQPVEDASGRKLAGGGLIPGPPLTLRLERQAGTDPELDALMVPRRSRAPWLIAFAALAIAAAVLATWPRAEPAVPAAVAAKPIDVAPPPPPPAGNSEPYPSPPAPPAVVAETSSPQPAPQPLPPPRQKADEELLTAPVKPAPPTVVVKEAARPMRVEIRETSCEPNDRWRASARAHLEELQQLAASKDDKRAWSLFEDAEPKLNASIDRAATGVDCEAVEQRIQKLAHQLKR